MCLAAGNLSVALLICSEKFLVVKLKVCRNYGYRSTNFYFDINK